MAIFKPLSDILLKIGIKYIILVRFRWLFCRIIGFFNPSGLEDIGQNVKYVSFAFLQICKKKIRKNAQGQKKLVKWHLDYSPLMVTAKSH